MTTTSDPSKRIMIAGTFELLHPGHIALIQEAAKLGKVTVVVARDSTVRTLRGRPSLIPEQQRLNVIKHIKGVDNAILGNEGPERFLIVQKVQPDIIFLGHNQDVGRQELEDWIQRNGFHASVRRMRTLDNRFQLSSTSSIIQHILANSKYFE